MPSGGSFTLAAVTRLIAMHFLPSDSLPDVTLQFESLAREQLPGSILLAPDLQHAKIGACGRLSLRTALSHRPTPAGTEIARVQSTLHWRETLRPVDWLMDRIETSGILPPLKPIILTQISSPGRTVPTTCG